MLEILKGGFTTAKTFLQGKTTLTEENIHAALDKVRWSLFEADVEYRVVDTFLERVKSKCIGEIVTTRISHHGHRHHLKPYDHFIKICYDELVALIGPSDASLKESASGPTSLLVVGLNGAGKTTTVGKLGYYLKSQGKSVLLVAVDIYRPAAIQQLKIIGERLDIPVYTKSDQPPETICAAAYRHATTTRTNYVIYDTAGRQTIDDALMAELTRIKEAVTPDNILLVCDAMIGQDAVKTAKAFDDRLNATGVILSKLDGDTRGGAAISIKEVTGKPIKFLGMGESLDRLEVFRPDGLASRILGFGDIVGLVKDFERVVDEKKAESDTKRLLSGQFTLIDFVEQIRTIRKMGPLTDLMDKIPMMGNMLPGNFSPDERELDRIISITQSMTHSEKYRPDTITPSRVARIAKGCGRSEGDVRNLLTKFFQMRKMLNQFSKGGNFLSKIPGFKQLSKMGISDIDMLKADDAMLGKKQDIWRELKPTQNLSTEAKRKLKNKRKRAKQSRKKARR